MARLEKIGYGQLELNQFAAPRDGRIEAQCALNTADFHEAGVKYGENVYNEDVPAENGMILAINRVKRTVGFPTGATNEILALNYTTEHMYDDRDLGSLRKFKLFPGTFYPRLGFLAIGDKFTTNTVELTTAWDALDEALEAGLFVYPGKDGYWTNVTDNIVSTEGVIAQVIKKTTMPDGQKAVKLQIVKA
jgi:hypothetical protein